MITESQIEQRLIRKLEELKYTYRPDIRDKATLEQNFREKFEALNYVNLTDAEFARLRDEIVSADVFKAATTLREQGYFQREDGTPLHYSLVNLKDWCKNEFEVINQLRINTDSSHHRYDVILLINGLPLVQIELKSLGINPRRAMEQIIKYRNDIGNGYANTLLCFMQLFVVSNCGKTCYFANNQDRHFTFNADERFLPIYQWADANNNKVLHLDHFAEQFLAKCTLAEMISRYMVLVATEQKLMIMRPYQIYAVKAIVDCIEQNRGNGYIWHTTGSGKTLTSFKASTLLKDNPDIEKCLFVVDRKDLDRQTRMEFNKFQEGCVEENTNTDALVRRLLSEDYADKVIVSTIQKLGLALDETSKKARQQVKRGKTTYKQRLEPLRDRRIVIIFDECHRSQFGENHEAIKEFFPKAQLFGFTGTPIFEENAICQKFDGTVGSYKTTEDIFQKQLHAYTIAHAIENENVLRFHVDYFKPETSQQAEDEESTGSKAKKTSPQPPRTVTQQAVVEAILDKHNTATNHRRFNALLATASINDAISYHKLFKQVQEERKAEDSDFSPLNIACVFSPPTQALAKDREGGNDRNVKDVKQFQEDLPQEKQDNQNKPEEKKAALMEIITDYNDWYGTNHNINEFDLYYQDIQKRIKDQQYPNSDLSHDNKIDITIVVDMLLTGFDSKYLNTLYVDKNLKHHGLIQALSRTNRILNSTKPYGNILDFRKQQEAVDEAIALFSGEDTGGSPRIWLVDPAPKVIDEFEEKVKALDEFLRQSAAQGAEDTPAVSEPEIAYTLKGDAARVEFIDRFKKVQRLGTQLDQYTDLSEEQKKQIDELLPKDRLQALRTAYLDTAQRLREQQGKTGASASDAQGTIDQLDFEFVLFSSALIDYDYIMELIARYSREEPGKRTMSREQLIGLLTANSNLMDEREDIIDYINTLEAGKGLDERAIRDDYQTFKANKAQQELGDMADSHGLEYDALKNFVDGILDRMIFDGEQLSDLFAPLDLSWKARTEAELALMEELAPFLRKRAEGREISGLAAYE